MLQQTQVATVIPYFERFVARFPDLATLSAADPDEVFAHWSGLGYYRRVRWLHAAARTMVRDGHRHPPDDAGYLRRLPGFGAYLTAAVLSLAFDRPAEAIDGNVERVVARLTASHDPIGSPKLRRAAQVWIREHRRGSAGDFTEALFELGALVCTRPAPKCGACPVAAGCAARARGLVATLPIGRARHERRTVAVRMLVLTDAAGARLWVRRGDTGLFAGLWEYPTVIAELPDGSARGASPTPATPAGRVRSAAIPDEEPNRPPDQTGHLIATGHPETVAAAGAPEKPVDHAIRSGLEDIEEMNPISISGSISWDATLGPIVHDLTHRRLEVYVHTGKVAKIAPAVNGPAWDRARWLPDGVTPQGGRSALTDRVTGELTRRNEHGSRPSNVILPLLLILWLFATALPGLAMPAGSDELAELQGLLAEADQLKRSLTGPGSRIAPDLGRFQQEYDLAIDRIAFLKSKLIDDIGRGVERGDLEPLDRYLSFVDALPTDARMRGQLLPLSSALRSKLLFSTVGQPTGGTAREAIASRLAFLERNRGVIKPLPPSEVTTAAAATQPTTPAGTRSGQTVPIHIAFLWHMHQPIYWPDEDVVTTQQRNVYSFSLFEVFTSRAGPYTDWPHNAVKAAADAGLPHAGAQVSFSGSLIENLDRLSGVCGEFRNWAAPYRSARDLRTALGNPRLDLVAFGYHHPLMALIGYEDIRRQVAAHRAAVQRTFGKQTPASKGIFPPENAFAEWMIPALVDEGLEWVLVDNIHFNRACQNYPWVKGENLFPPNPADQVNPDPGNWVQLNGLWAPSKVSAWGCRPHYVETIDPTTGRTARTPDGRPARIIAVPTERYLGNEDGRGGFGALNYEAVMSQLLPYNTDPDHPLLLVLHHDGDNYGGGSDSYYHANFRRFVEWVKANPDRFVCTTIQDYLQRFPPATDDVIHVEPGSWAGADNGDPEFLKWNGHPDPKTDYSPDRNSWGVMTATRHVVALAQDQQLPRAAVELAIRRLSVAQTSCYEYWDGTEMWDSHPTRGCNLALETLLPLLTRERPDRTPPAIYQPQRRPYNPGGREWGASAEPADFTVWTYAYDHGGLKSVELAIRTHAGQRWPDAAARRQAGGEWKLLPMQARTIPAQTNPKPLLKADEYAAQVTGVRDALCDYYVKATDRAGNVTCSPLLHVYVGKGEAGGGEEPALTWSPAQPAPGETVTFTSTRPGKLHWGINGWTLPPTAMWPPDTEIWPDRKAVETPMAATGGTPARYRCSLVLPPTAQAVVTRIDAVMHHADDTWGKDVQVPVAATP